MSVRTAVACPPAPLIRATARAAASSPREPMTTRIPTAASRSLTACPIPRDPPVTKYQHSVTKVGEFIVFGGGDDNRRSRRGDLGDDLQDLFARADVDALSRFMEQQDRRVGL